MREDILRHDKLIGIQAATFREIYQYAVESGYKGQQKLSCCCCAKDLPGTLLIATEHTTNEMHIFCDLQCVGDFFMSDKKTGTYEQGQRLAP
jgi:hypothetical protein